MAEALAVISLVSAIVQFVDFGTKVIGRFHELREEVARAPKVFKDVQTRLLLMLDLVKKIQIQIQNGYMDKTSQEVMLPVIQSCLSQVKQLDDLFMKAAPKLHDSSWNQGKKAFISVIRESELDKIDLALKTNCDLLLQSGTYHSMSWLEKKDPNFLQQMVNFIVPQQQVYDSARRSDSTSVAPVFMVPFQRDPKYLRRPAIMEEIASRFKNQCQVALAGLGGVGKSQVAIEYCYLFRDENPHAHVFWIYAGTTSRFEQGYQEMARRLTLLGWDDPKVDTLKLVYEWLLRCVREFNRA